MIPVVMGLMLIYLSNSSSIFWLFFLSSFFLLLLLTASFFSILDCLLSLNKSHSFRLASVP